MPRGTLNSGALAPLEDCYIVTPCGNICLKILPDITDSKGATYSSTNIPGRSTPLINYSYSNQRTLTTELHFMTTISQDITDNFNAIRLIQDLVYPGPASGTAPFTPPPVVKFVCGDLLDGPNGLCLILQSYNIRYPTDVAWDEQTYLPYKFSITCNWEVVYACKDLPVNKCLAGDIDYLSNPGSSPTSLGGQNVPKGFRMRGMAPKQLEYKPRILSHVRSNNAQ